MSIKVAVFNCKGGVGKTTLSIILTQIALKHNKKVIAFDQSEQQDFYHSMSYLTKEDKIKDLLTLNNIPLSKKEDLDIPADLLIIDCSSSLENQRTKIAIKNADFVLIPVQPDEYSIKYLYEIRAVAGEYKELFQFPLVKVDFMEDNIHDKSLAARTINKIISEKGYPVIGDVPMYDKIRASLSCGLKKWWSVGLTAIQRKHFEFIYTKLEFLNQKLSVIRKSILNRPIPKYDYYEDPENFDIVSSPRLEHYVYSHVDNKVNQSSKKLKEFVRENGLLVY